jgi:hypothetical protein
LITARLALPLFVATVLTIVTPLSSTTITIIPLPLIASTSSI